MQSTAIYGMVSVGTQSTAGGKDRLRGCPGPGHQQPAIFGNSGISRRWVAPQTGSHSSTRGTYDRSPTRKNANSVPKKDRHNRNLSPCLNGAYRKRARAALSRDISRTRSTVPQVAARHRPKTAVRFCRGRDTASGGVLTFRDLTRLRKNRVPRPAWPHADTLTQRPCRHARERRRSFPECDRE